MTFSSAPVTWHHIASHSDVADFIRIVEWILSSGAIDRGILAPDIIGFNEDSQEKRLWEIYLEGLKTNADSHLQYTNWKPVYQNLYFCDPEDAMVFKLKFT